MIFVRNNYNYLTINQRQQEITKVNTKKTQKSPEFNILKNIYNYTTLHYSTKHEVEIYLN